MTRCRRLWKSTPRTNPTQGMLLKAVPNSKMFERCSAKLLDLGIVHSARACQIKIKKLRQDYKKIKDYNNKSGNDQKTSKWYERLDALLGHRPSFSGTASTVDSGTMVWEAAQTADSVANDDDHDEGEAGQLSGLETSELSPPDRNSSACSSPFPPTKRKGTHTRAQDENFFDTIEAMEDRRAVVKESMHGDQMGLLSKAQETEDKMLTMMERQAEVLTRQKERQERQDEVSAQRHERQDERQTSFQNGFLEVLSQLVKANRSSSL
ncbi:hypothetical protein NQZ68_035410 [Dissostichus eleginoides]|nr:hypothetical protein NQZ68_035410 [Dissostichus eleginoides]